MLHCGVDLRILKLGMTRSTLASYFKSDRDIPYALESVVIAELSLAGGRALLPK
jgi:hypothetical protein